MPPKGRPPKKKRNISGLKNQSASSEIPTSQNGNNTDGDKVDDQPPKDLKDMAGSEQEDEPYSDFEPDHEWESITSRELGKRLAAQSCAIDKDSTDTDWIPFKLRKKKGYKERPTSYIKGPDVMSKSDRTRCRYAKSFKDQAQLDAFFQRPALAGSESSILQARKVSDRSISSESEELEIIDASSSVSRRQTS